MSSHLQAEATVESQQKNVAVKVFGVGNAGIHVAQQLMGDEFPHANFIAVDTAPQSLAASAAAEKLHLETPLLRGLGTGGDPDRGRAIAEENASKFRTLCEGADVVFIVAGLGGGAGTGISPVLARAAREAGALVVGFVLLPFDCEGSRRKRLAQQGLDELKAAADGVICLPNQRVFKLINENTSVLETFKITNELLADGLRGFWRLLIRTGLIEIHFGDLCALLRNQHAESVFAVAEATGAARSQEVTDKLLAHPMLDGGEVLGETHAVLVSLMGGPDLTMSEVNRVMEQINGHCERAQIIMGAVIDESFRDRLAVTLIATRKGMEPQEVEPRATTDGESLHAQLLSEDSAPRPGSRFVPPAPTLPPDQMQQLLARQNSSRSRKASARLRQGQLALEIISKGRFDKSEPTIHKGEDLDVPTYIRRNVALN